MEEVLIIVFQLQNYFQPLIIINAFVDFVLQKKIFLYLVIEVIFMAAVVFITLYFFHTTKTRSMFIGILAIVFNVAMYTSPLTVMVCSRSILWLIHFFYVGARSRIINSSLFFKTTVFWQHMVIKTKSVKYMPFTLSLFNFLNGVIWVVYALLKFDPYVLVIN